MAFQRLVRWIPWLVVIAILKKKSHYKYMYTSMYCFPEHSMILSDMRCL